ncbi:foldase protein PrsA precursor [Clostridium tepidiprofundi DSM 19306]|uniref:peptidylprolyl isomerase n=2 Tax=Clostridium TaxID=1485 RepID=A0A151B2Q7_9CLOT|nr:foldase protein PrsA precursor [Clostridium tepidiprofundi DSM 19306]
MIKMSKKMSILLSTLLLTGMISGCSTAGTAKKDISNGVIAKFNQGSIEHNELFNRMLKTSGMSAVLEIADAEILNKILPATDDMKKEAKEKIDEIKKYYGDSFKDVLKSSGISNEQEYLNLLLLSLQRRAYITKYIEDNVLTDEEIKKYYDNYEPKIRASHILIKPAKDTKDDWNKALKEAKDLIARLDKGEDFAKLAKEYSADKGSAINGGDLGSFGKGQMVPEFEKAAYALKVNQYTKQPVKSVYGYHIILKTDEDKKGTLEEMRPNIVKTLSEKILKSDNKVSSKALIKMRNDNGFTINDKIIKDQYDAFVKKIESSIKK